MTNPSSEDKVQFQSGDVTLAGTIVTPGSRGPHPAVVFIHGSGRQDRDNYRTVADHFAKHGIAGLVYDKRGVGESTGEFPNDAVSSFSDLPMMPWLDWPFSRAIKIWTRAMGY